MIKAIAVVVFVSSSFTTTVLASECAGVKLPDRVAVNGTSLVLNGMGLRRATIFSVQVYVGGLYLQKPSHNAGVVLATDTAKRLVLYFVRDVSQSEMAGAIDDGIRKNAGAKAKKARVQVADFTRRLPPLRKGTDLTFTYIPHKGLEIAADGKLLGEYRDASFAQLFFRIWFGPEPPDRDLKNGMLGASCD